MSSYQKIYNASLADPARFWAEQAEAIDWVQPPQAIHDPAPGPLGQWFPDASLNTCFNALDRHVIAGRGKQPAIHYDSPVTNTRSTITYEDLLEDVSAFAGGLQALGIGVGDRVVIY